MHIDHPPGKGGFSIPVSPHCKDRFPVTLVDILKGTPVVVTEAEGKIDSEAYRLMETVFFIIGDNEHITRITDRHPLLPPPPTWAFRYRGAF
jgi:hypothetical protein